MDDRYRNHNERQGNEGGWRQRERQDEQFAEPQNQQYGDTAWRSRQSGGGNRWSQDGGQGGYGGGYGQRDDHARSSGGYRSDTSAFDDYDRQGFSRYGGGHGGQGQPRGGYGGQSYGREGGQSFRQQGGQGYGQGFDQGGSFGQDRYGQGGYGQGSYRPSDSGQGFQRGSYRSGSYGGGGHIPERQYDRDERGFFDRASDEVMSWFGDDDAARRRKMDAREDHSGRGPANYTRSPERLIEDANERLTRDPHIDASRVTVTCKDNEITLEGTVDSRSAKRRAEDLVEDISGVKHVQNNLRVETRESYYSQGGSASYGTSSSGLESGSSTTGGKTQA
ncbi:BON domain-containing protein [Qipengyuania sediminis]|uniref:BON domain-containing protein n=1 Tax=Qipengyuania sediminis TaxID=1532023 RepID=UPI0010596BC8|nr:BON domain-containing protein [Qipengyuania sediminis]